MAFLNEQGVERLWQHVVAKIDSSSDLTTEVLNKLNTIAEGAEVNVNPDWNAISGDAQILNKPTIPTIDNYLATIGTTWIGSAAPYSQDITITGITTNDKPIVDVTMSGTYTTDEARLADWGKIYRIVTGANKITVYAKEATTVELPIQLQVVR